VKVNFSFLKVLQSILKFIEENGLYVLVIGVELVFSTVGALSVTMK